MVARHHQPAVFKLDAAAGPRGVPRPAFGLDRRRDVDRLRPGGAVVLAVTEQHLARAGAGAALVLGLGVATRVAGQGQPDTAGATVEDRAGVADGVAPGVSDELKRAPGLAAIGAAPQHHVDVARVRPAVLAALAKGEQSAP